MPKQYYFSVEEINDFDHYICVCISPKDYTDKHHCIWDQHLGNSIGKELNALPFMLSEDSECMFSVWDLGSQDFDGQEDYVEPTQQNIQWVKNELKKLGWIEKQPGDWLK